MPIKKRFLLLIIMFLFFLIGSIGQGHTAPITIDVNNPDPYVWDKIQDQMKERENTRRQVGYFSLGKETLELRAALEYDDKGFHDDFDLLEAPKGGRFGVSKKPEIDSSDIYGILIEKTIYDQIEEYTITLHLKQESWDKFNEVTTRLIKKYLAIIRGQTFLSAPKIIEPLTDSAKILGDFKSDDIERFKKGLIPMDQQAIETWNRKSTEWLEERSKRNPNDAKIQNQGQSLSR